MSASPAQAKTPTESAESRLLVSHAFELARGLGIQKLLVHADELVDRRSIDSYRENEVIIWLSRDEHKEDKWTPDKRDFKVELPDAKLDRMDQINMGLLLAVLNDYIESEETILCLTGLVGSQRLDNLLITNPRRDSQWFRRHQLKPSSGLLASRTFNRLIEIAMRFASEGREGKPIGTIFVLGELKELEPHLKQLILNPFKGHRKELRNIHRNGFSESLRELSALDGAFIVSRSGVAERAAVYLDAPLSRKIKLRPGLGARHAAAAAISAKTESIGIVISESSGTVTVFHEGSAILELERPGPGSNGN